MEMGFSPGFQCCQRLGTANRCAVPCFTWVFDKSWGEQWADQQWTYAWCYHWLLLTHA